MFNLQEVVKDEVDRTIKVYEKFKKKEIDPIAKLGNPEKIINKPYEQWNPQDIQMLREVYVYSPEDLEEFMVKKDVQEVWDIQKITKGLEV